MSGFIVNKPQAQSYYNASKAGVHHLTSRSLPSGARGVRVNAVAPTYINTPLTAFAANDPAWVPPGSAARRWAGWEEPTRSRRSCLFLASDAASLLTGSVVVADGGYTCW